MTKFNKIDGEFNEASFRGISQLPNHVKLIKKSEYYEYNIEPENIPEPEMYEEHPNSEGVAVYATTEKYKEFFSDVDYKLIKEVSVGNVSGSLMVHYRES